MKHRIIFIAILSIFTIEVYSQVADTVYRDAKIYTANSNDDFAEAMAIKDGKIIFIGSNANVSSHIGTGTVVLGVNGDLILPGIHDVHNHILEASSSISSSCTLSNTETDPENFISVMQACNNSTPNNNGWILGSGHSIYTLLDATRDPKLILDDVYPNTPAAYMEETSHSFWVNTAALQALGITSSTPDPTGGHIVKNQNGQPNGILLDGAGDLIWDLALAPNTANDDANYFGLRDTGLPLLAENGITSLVEGRTYWKRNFISTWQRLKDNNELTVRVVLAPWVYPEDNDNTQITQLQNLYNTGDDLLKVTQIKLYSDGITINATAALHDPYNDNLGFPFTTGLNYITQARMTNLITSLETVGYDFFIHVIGDRGTTESLNAIESARNTNGDIGARHRLTHLEIVRASDFPRFNTLNVTADMQVAGDFTNPSNWNEIEFLVGASRADNLIPLKSLNNANARITLSSDYDVSALNPFVGMQNALTRSPQELPDVQTVVKAYTINGAYSMRRETVTGSLEVNKYADFIVVDRDIFTIPANQVAQTNVLLTVLGNQEIYRENGYTLSNEDISEAGVKLNVYPTIVNDSLNVKISNSNDTYNLKIFSLKGDLVKQKRLGDDNTLTIDVSKFSEGVYIVKVISESKKTTLKTKKIIVSR
ncbi:amidohydrolase family protein [Pseudotenacibaculum sp. MALMAid0570]|uniref:amidohydrolase family protein n=1 Tax=Pseudotenacibaculum sp. MALMAid0570 TaxID=3143938 RepID=UPI0032DE519E